MPFIFWLKVRPTVANKSASPHTDCESSAPLGREGCSKASYLNRLGAGSRGMYNWVIHSNVAQDEAKQARLNIINAQPDQLLPQASLCGRPLTYYKSPLATEDTVAAAQLTLLLYSGRGWQTINQGPVLCDWKG
jgi:hypothetical protein